MALLLIRLQVAGIYLHASMAKFGVQEWADGTAMYYWLLDPGFGVTGWLRAAALPVLLNAAAVALLGWGVMLFELLLATGLLLPRRARHPLLIAGIAFHLGITVLMGLISFSIAMTAALLLFLRPVDAPLFRSKLAALARPAWLWRRRPARPAALAERSPTEGATS